MKRQISFFLLILVIGLGIGIYIGKCMYQQPKPISNNGIVIPDSIVKQENETIDSLETLNGEISGKIENVKDSIVIVTKWKGKEVNRIKELPLDSAIIYLNKKLRKYEND